MDKPRQFIHPVLAIAFGILAMASAAIFIRFAQQFAPSIVIAAYRLTLASLLLVPIALARNRSELRNLERSQLAFGLLSGLFLALHFATWITSLAYTTVASSVMLVSTVPLWVALLAPITIKEPLSRPIISGMGLALFGAIVIGISDVCTLNGTSLTCPPLDEFIQGNAFLGDILALIGAIMGAGYVLIGKKLRTRVSLLSYIFVVYGMAAIILVLIMFAMGESPFGYPPQAYIWFLLLALFPQLLGHSSVNWALGYLSAAYVSIILLSEPIGSTILAYLLFEEVPSSMKIFGAILILAGIFIASRTEMISKTN